MVAIYLSEPINFLPPGKNLPLLAAFFLQIFQSKRNPLWIGEIYVELEGSPEQEPSPQGFRMPLKLP